MKKSACLIPLFFVSFCVFGQTKTDAKSHIWAPSNWCELPANLNIPCNIECRNCYWKTITCEEIAKKGTYTAVRIRFMSKTDSTFGLKTKFKNIGLKTKANGRILHPYAILWHNSEIDSKTEEMVDKISFMTNKFRTKSYVVKFKSGQAYDLILLFKQAQAGDIVSIDKFLKTEINK
ncbi:MAG: hypothetical protein WCQ95_07600 [Bacteroidota bacterium]